MMKEKLIEVWKPVVGYEKYYEVSNLGRVKRLPRTFVSVIGRKIVYKEKILKSIVHFQRSHGTGNYVEIVVNLHKDKTMKQFRIAKLVLTAFAGSAPSKECNQIRHLDSDSTNNWLFNLRWGTVYENNEDLVKSGNLLKSKWSKKKVKLRWVSFPQFEE